MNDLVSIIWTTYHESIDLIKLSLDSLINQTHQNCEIIVINDDSVVKGVDEFLSYYTSIHPNCEYINLKKNVGFVGAKNVGLSIARGQYILMVDADYIMQKYFIQYAVDTFKAHDDCYVVWGPQLFASDLTPQAELDISSQVWKIGDKLFGPVLLIGHLYKSNILSDVGYMKRMQVSDADYSANIVCKYESESMRSYWVEYPENIAQSSRYVGSLLPWHENSGMYWNYYSDDKNGYYQFGCAQICQFNRRSNLTDDDINLTDEASRIFNIYLNKFNLS